jgi:hypothetical protein
MIVKSAKMWCLAVGFLVCAGLPPVARAQNPQDQQRNSNNVPPKFDPNETVRREYYRWNTPYRLPNDQRWYRTAIGADGGGFFAGSAAPPDLHLATVDDSLRDHLNLPKNQGIVVISVDPNSSAAQAGIQQNDVLLSLGDKPLEKPKDLYEQLRKADEQSVALTLLRAGSRVTLQVQPLVRVTLSPVAVKAPPREYWIGISVTAVEPVLRAQLRLSQPHAVIVNQVIADGPAAKAGIMLHDIIVSLDGKPILDPNDVAKTVQAKGEKPLVLELIGKGGKSRTVEVTPGRKKLTEASQANPAGPQNVAAWEVVHPGVVVQQWNGFPSWSDDLQLEVQRNPLNTLAGDFWSVNPKTLDGRPALTQRLDSLDSDMKELRKLVEELQKTATRIIERQKSASDSSTKD